MIKHLTWLVSSFLGIGHLPVAPGTWTSLAVVLLYKFFLFRLAWPYYLLVFLIVFFIGVLASSLMSSRLNNKDPRTVVIDEAAGQLLPLFLLSPEWPLLGISFLLFRFFDIAKPFPIRKIENMPSGWGIMLDDIVAGLYTGIIINIYLLLR
jgi:phosphatidylglycerophosphatase A